MQGFDAVIFDLDGVLLLSEGINVEAMVTTMKLRGMPLTKAEIRTIPGKSSMDAMPDFFRRRNIPETDHLSIIEENRARYDRLWDAKVQLAPHADATLNAFRKKGLPLAIGTTNRRSVVDKFIERFAFDDFFTTIVTGRDVTRRKPDPEVYLLVRERLGIPSKKIIVVEDTQFGVTAAKDARLTCAAIPSEFFRDQDFSRADFVLPSLQDLLPIVIGNGE